MLKVLIFCLGFTTNLYANTTAQDFSKLKDYAKSLNGQPLGAMHQFHPESTFKDYNQNPSQQNHYSGVETEKMDLTGAAQAALNHDAGGKVVVEHFGQNQFEINKNNQAIKQAKLIEDESYAITHGISNARVNCDSKAPICEMKSHQEICHTSRQLPNQTCTKKRQVTVGTEHIHQMINVEVVIAKKWTGIVTVNLMTGAINNAYGGRVVSPIQLHQACENFKATIHSVLNNGKRAGWVWLTGLPTCANNGLLTLYISEKYSRVYPIQIALTVDANSKAYVADDHWDSQCAALEGKKDLCHQIEEHCTIPNATRVIDGLPVTRDCWEMGATYACSSAKTDECQAQKSKGCLQASSHCAQMEGNICALYEQVYTCTDKVCEPSVACVKDLFCADGDCTEHISTQNNHFAEDIAPLAVAGKAGREFGQTQTTLFGGHPVQCKIWALDIIDCCSDKGWGKDLNLLHCRDEDKALGQAKLNYLAHYIGEYCSDRVLGVCVEHKRSYCVFNTKMARIIQEEGRLKQLNPNAMGDAEYPNCAGMSVEELQRLDMSKIEFLKPIYPYHDGIPTTEAGIAANPPNMNGIQDEVLKRVQKKVGAP